MSPSDVPSLNSSLTPLIQDSSDTSDISVKSGVIITSTSPKVRCLPRNPPQSRLPPVSSSSSSLQSINFNTVPILALSPHISKIYNLFTSSSFNEKGCIFPPVDNYYDLYDRIQAADISLSPTDYFEYLLRFVSTKFCTSNLHCCDSCGLKSHPTPRLVCFDMCSDCTSSDHHFCKCPKFLSWLHDPIQPYHSTWLKHVANELLSYSPLSKIRGYRL